MVDPGVGLAALGGATVSKDTISRILGPTADYIGDGVKTWTEKGVANVQRVFAKAEERLAGEIDRPGRVPPRVLKIILEEGQFANDELSAAYLGGVLASSRTEAGRDDRAVSMGHLVASLSTYALRTHYLLYRAVHRSEVGANPQRWRMVEETGGLRRFLALTAYNQAMAFDGAELENLQGIVADTMLTLGRHRLVGEWLRGPPDFLSGHFGGRVFAGGGGIVAAPTQPGVLLFCAAHGVRTDPYVAFTTDQLDAALAEDVPQMDVPLVTELPQVGD
jgi:hypothetical protein